VEAENPLTTSPLVSTASGQCSLQSAVASWFAVCCGDGNTSTDADLDCHLSVQHRQPLVELIETRNPPEALGLFLEKKELIGVDPIGRPRADYSRRRFGLSSYYGRFSARFTVANEAA
jgi:hypothetical protein